MSHQVEGFYQIFFFFLNKPRKNRKVYILVRIYDTGVTAGDEKKMEQYIGKDCKVHVDVGGKDLFYTARITNVSQTHISFIDKFGEVYTFRLTDVVEIRG